MLRKSLLFAVCLCFGAASLALAASGNDLRPSEANASSRYMENSGRCYTGLNGRGQVLPEVTTQNQCREYSPNGSWEEYGDTSNNYNAF